MCSHLSFPLIETSLPFEMAVKVFSTFAVNSVVLDHPVCHGMETNTGWIGVHPATIFVFV